jgi:hypothetical protein
VSSAYYSDEFAAWVRGRRVSGRAEKARELLLAHGTVTTGDLAALGYDHPPRAIADLKDAGIARVKAVADTWAGFGDKEGFRTLKEFGAVEIRAALNQQGESA